MLCGTALRTGRSRRVHRFFELLASQVEGSLLGELTAPFLFGSTFLQQKGAVVDDIVRSTKPSEEGRAFLRAQAQSLATFDGEGLCAHVACPTLCLAGAEDTLTPPAEVEATAARIPGAGYECIAGAGHSLLLESAAAFERVVAFLRA